MAPKRALSKSSRAASRPKPKRTRLMIEDNQYFVEDILAERTNANGESEYLVLWEGYPRDQATWEPSDNIEAELIADFIAQREEDISSQEGDEDDDEKEEVERTDRPAMPPVARFRLPIGALPPTPREFLDSVHADQIIGADDTNFLLSHRPNPTTGETVPPLWIPRHLMDPIRARAWQQLIQRLIEAIANQLETDDHESSPGAVFFAQHEYYRIRGTPRSLFIQERTPGAPTLQETLGSIGIAVDPSIELTDRSPDSPDSPAGTELTETGEDPGVIEHGSGHESDDQVGLGKESDEILVSPRRQHPTARPVGGDSTNNSRIDGHTGNSVAQTAHNESSAIADAGSRIGEESGHAALSSQNTRPTQVEESESVITAEDAEAVLGVDLGLGKFWTEDP